MKITSSAKVSGTIKEFLSNNDFIEYFNICSINLRQISHETIVQFMKRKNIDINDRWDYTIIQRLGGIGCDPVFYDEITNTTWPAIIAPTSDRSFMAISIPQDINEESICRKIGSDVPFNVSVLYKATPIYIVESVFDVISIQKSSDDVAIALGSTNFIGLLDYIDQNKIRPEYPLLLSLDNDDEGYNAALGLLSELSQRNITAIICNISGNFKSPNALDAAPTLCIDGINSSSKIHFYSGESLRDNISAQRKKITQNAYSEATKNCYITLFSPYGKLQDFKRSVAFKRFSSPISTGFQSLDCSLGGGLYSNLIVIGAISSLGKTAFVLQIADQIAKNNHDVLFFALEMNVNELIARSISRESFLWCGNERSPDEVALSTLDIFNGLKTDNKEKILSYDYALSNYETYSKHIFIITPSQNKDYATNTTEGIKSFIEEHIRVMRQTPVIIIDYLQLLNITQKDKNISDKQIVDKNIIALKKISSDFDTPVIAVSSLNRASYNSKEIDFSAFKESGSIEYSCDTLIGLQFMDKSDINEAKQKEPRDIEAVILKQRNGPVGTKVSFSFHAKFNYFEEC